MTQWKLVPVEPTEEMLKVQTWDFNRFYSPGEVWKAMLAAVPQLAQEPVAWMSEDGNRLAHHQHRDYTRPLYAAPTQAAPDPEFDVRRILLDIVPGDGDGLEVYAKSVQDVERKLSAMGERIEELEGTRQAAPAAELVEALRFYAEESNYKDGRVCNDGDGHFDIIQSTAEDDAGAKARTALARYQEATK